MAQLEIFFEIPDSKYGEGVILNEYNGTISLIAGGRNKQGINFFKWCFPQRDKKPIDKAVPWKIEIGRNRKEAATMLQKILSELSE